MAKTTEAEIVSVRPTSGALSFFLPDDVDAALRKSGFTVEEEFALLVDSIRNADNVWARLAAMRYFDHKLEKSLVLSGAVRMLEGRMTKDGPDGSRCVLESKTMKLLERAATHAQLVHDEKELEDDEERPPVEGGEDEGFGPDFAGGKPIDVEVVDHEPLPGDSQHDAYLQLFDGHKPPTQAGGGLS